ncbi:MAG: hypothetical protein ACWGSD_00480 [Thermodesulfobacteriota bacterium]
MTRQARLCCAWSVLFFFLFALFSPDDALCFDWEDNLKTAGIVAGITVGVALIIVLVVGVVHDTKRDRDKEDEDDDVWTKSPVLRTLGYRHLDDPLFGPSPVHPEGLAGKQELEAFLAGKIDNVRFHSPYGECTPDPRHFRPGGVPTGFSLSYPAAGRAGNPPPFSLYRSCRIEDETGGAPGTT